VDGDWDELVRRAMAVKIRLIQEDPYEKGSRASLNLGHTLGHAVELASDYQLKHGEAVSIGMVAAARMSEKIGLAEDGLSRRIVDVLVALGLPVKIPGFLSRQRILQAMGVDKKRSDGKVRFVLPVRVGEVRWGVEVDDWAQFL
jgi:3-dehydroquinate synthetase